MDLRFFVSKKVIRALLLTSFISILSVLCGSSLYNISIAEKSWAYDGPDQDTTLSSQLNLLENIALEEFFSVVNVSSANVFLTWPLEPLLMYRALCSVESWALNHPNASVWYVFTVKEIQDTDGLVHKLLAQYSNLKFIYVDLKKVFQGTPLYNLSLSSEWEKSKWPGTHLSDFLRQALVWQKGGYYSDTDVYPIKSLSSFRNFIMIHTGGPKVAPVLMNFDVHHPWVKEYMETIAADYQPMIRAHHGPVAGTKTGERLCDGPGGFLELQANGSYRDCTVEGHTFRFLTYKHCPHNWYNVLNPGLGKDFDKVLEDALAFHVSNSLTRPKPDPLSSGSLMQVMAERHCPLIHNHVGTHNNFW